MTNPMSMPRRRFLTLAGGGAAVALFGAGCGGEEAADDTFDVWVLQDENVNPVSQASLDRHNASAGTKGVLRPEVNTGYRDKVHISVGTNQRPDVFFNWGGGSIRTYAREGLLEDLTPHLDADPAFKGAFLPSVLDAGKIDGKFYGIPMRTMQPVHMFYNTKVFGEVGVEIPQTWTQFLDVCERLKSAGVTPVALAGAQSWTELMWIEYLVERIGGAQVFADIAAGTPGAWQNPAVTRAVDTITSLVDSGVFGTNFPAVEWEGGAVQQVFSSGQAAMHLMGSWEYTTQLGSAPEFARNDLAWGPFPVIEDGAGAPDAVVGNPTNYFSVTKDSAHKDAAIAYLKAEMASEAYVDGLISIGDVPAVTDITDRLASAENPDFATFVYDLVAKAPSFQLSWDQAVERELAGPMLDALSQVFLGELDAAGFVKANEDAAA
ncbi:extracellular solute-binding protein [Phytomonospora sp. NPDC050363]|uniref:ABC transporter substrate-binding protein n=1 Tax=Phytomonospora sp. NPDC050363 TaxID=3155642 RepID=UPI0034022E47